MLIFGFSSVWVLAGIKKDTMKLYLIDMTLYYYAFISNITIP